MSPPARAPPIPMAMAGGRPIPGNQLRRPSAPTAWEVALARANIAPVTRNIAPQASDFAFASIESQVTPGTVAPPPTPVMWQEDGNARAVAASRPTSRSGLRGAAHAARARLLRPPAAARRAAGGLYGQALATGEGQVQYAASPRMEDW